MDYCAPSYLAAKRIRSIVCMMIFYFLSVAWTQERLLQYHRKKYPQYLSVTCCIRKDNEVFPLLFFLSHLVRKGDVPLFEYIVTSNTMGQFVCLMHESTLFLKREWWRLDLWFMDHATSSWGRIAGQNIRDFLFHMEEYFPSRGFAKVMNSLIPHICNCFEFSLYTKKEKRKKNHI